MNLAWWAGRFTDRNTIMVFLHDGLVWEGIPSLAGKTEFARYEVKAIHVVPDRETVVIDIIERM